MSTITQRVAARTTAVLDRDPTGPRHDRGRRTFLRRATVVATALVANPLNYILRPQSAYASVCGPSNECSQGWSAFCCTINGGANTCPDGSYTAGWWKVSSSAFCRGEDRYVVDCNRLPGSTCNCRCAQGDCDRRRVCCNNFRYGQCNQQIAGTTEVVCRIVICTPPWVWDDTCTTTIRTDERTREHTSSCLNPPNPTEIAVVYQDLGLVGSALGAPLFAEQDLPAGGSWRGYDLGVITRTDDTIRVAVGPAAERYRDLDGPLGPLGLLVGEQQPISPDSLVAGSVLHTSTGAIYVRPDGPAYAVFGQLDQRFGELGGPTGWLGFPVTDTVPAPGERERVFFDAGWSLVADPTTDEVRLLPSDVALSDQPQQWPSTAEVLRWDGSNRIQTAVRVSQEAHPDGAPFAVLAAASSFADALAGGVLAGVRGGPVLLTATDGLSADAATELLRLGAESVILVGGDAVLGQQVLADVVDLVDTDVTVRRIGGIDRFETAVATSEEMLDGRSPDLVYVASGRDFPDALTASPAAGAQRVPLLLTEPTELPQATGAALQAWAPIEVVVIGGPTAVSDDVVAAIEAVAGGGVARLAGSGRHETAAVVGLDSRTRPEERVGQRVLIATGDGFADALSAGAAAISSHSTLLLAGTDSLPAATRQAITQLQPSSLVMIGGPVALSETVAMQLSATPNEPYDVQSDPADTPAVPDPDDPTAPPVPPTLAAATN